jgi:hypothetical protein
VHTISLGHAPHFYVAGTLPEFSVSPNIYASSAMASSYFFNSTRFAEAAPFVPERRPEPVASPAPAPAPEVIEERVPLISAERAPVANGKPAAARPHFSRTSAHARDRKRAQTPASRSSRRPARDARTASSRPGAPSRPGAARVSSAARWAKPSTGNGKHNGSLNGNHTSRNGSSRNGHSANGNGKSNSSARVQRNGHAANGKVVAKSAVSARGKASRKDVRVDARSRKPALTAGAKAGNSKRYGFTAPAKQRTKKRG